MSQQILIQNFRSPYGELILGSLGGRLCLCDWKYRRQRNAVDQRIQRLHNAEYREGISPVTDLTIQQLSEYFEGSRSNFEIPIVYSGTDFQISVWEALNQIPFGESISYAELSRKLGNPKAVRAVASANGANALAIIIPCHRVIGDDGSLVGYAGGIQIKKKLLQLEGLMLNKQYQLFDSSNSS